MSKRKNRTRRDDPRTWDRDEFVSRMVERYKTEIRQALRRQLRQEAASPYCDIVLNMEHVLERARLAREIGVNP
jgi:hypothetical protein